MINDFPSSSSFFKFTMFADDTTISCKFNQFNPDIIRPKLEVELDKLYQWLLMNKIKVNCKKSKFIVFSYRNSKKLGQIKFGNETIIQTNSSKFLGINIDQNLNFKSHVSTIAPKLSRTVGILYRLNKFFPKNILKNLYCSLFLANVNYGIVAWYSAPQSAISRIKIIQKKAIRAIISGEPNTSVELGFRDMKLLTTDQIYHFNLGLHIFNCVENLVFPRMSQCHDLNTRNRQALRLPLYNRSKSQSSWMYQGISLWNSLPPLLRSSPNYKCFKYLYKNYLLSE